MTSKIVKESEVKNTVKELLKGGKTVTIRHSGEEKSRIRWLYTIEYTEQLYEIKGE